MTEWIPVSRIAVDAAMAMLIWLVQCLIYPSFHDVDRSDFSQWHQGYMNTISLFVVPLMLTQVALVGYQCFRSESYWAYASVIAIAVAWLATFFLSVPCHDALQSSGYETDVVNRLVNTNWIRTFAWNSVLVFALLAYRPGVD